MTPSPTKGATTREVILARAYALACVNGLEGLTIGGLAEQVGMSKSGVFAHFGSREDLQLATLDLGGELFIRDVLLPALREKRGLPRLRAIYANWSEWVRCGAPTLPRPSCAGSPGGVTAVNFRNTREPGRLRVL